MSTHNFIDIAGQQFGHLTVLRRAGSHLGHALWQCRCTCGQLTTVASENLRRGRTGSCGCRTGIDFTGQQFQRLTVLQRAGNNRSEHSVWLCRCVCGRLTKVNSSRLRSGHTGSCGCMRGIAGGDVTRTHGRSRTPIYAVWCNMLARCNNSRRRDYPNYGGRGIKVCKRWRKFENFLADMGERPPGMTLDRIDNAGNYKPGNCRWATRSQQRKNQRPPRRRADDEATAPLT